MPPKARSRSRSRPPESGKTPLATLVDTQPVITTATRRTRAASAKPASKPSAKPVSTARSRRGKTADVEMRDVEKANNGKKRGRTSDGLDGEIKKKPRVEKPTLNGPPKAEWFWSEERRKQFKFDWDIPKGRRGIFIFGSGDMGQFGLGTLELDEITRPKLHSWFQQRIPPNTPEEEPLNLANEAHSLPSPGVSDIECGGMHTLVVTSDGKLLSWGINDHSALGRPTNGVEYPKGHKYKTEDSIIEPEMLETMPMYVEFDKVDKNLHVVAASAGDSVSLAVGEGGSVRAWGSFRASDGLMGFAADDHSTQMKPRPYQNLEKVTVSSVVCGNDHVLLLTADGFIYAIGNGETGSLGRKIIQRRRENGLTPERVGLKNITLIGAGSYHSFGMDKNGVVYGWGLNSFHQLGLSGPQGDEQMVPSPAIISALSPSEHNGSKVVQISGGEHHSLFLFDDGSVWACGRCDENELGLGSDHPEMVKSNTRRKKVLEERAGLEKEELERLQKAEELNGEEAAALAQELAAQKIPTPNHYVPLPTKIVFPDNKRIVQISAGTRHNLAIGEGGEIYGWGYGGQSQLGLGDDDVVEKPKRILSKLIKEEKWFAVKASTGGQHSVVMAVKPE